MFEQEAPAAGGNDPVQGAATPSPISLTADSLIQLEGQKDAVKFSDFQKRQQADYTTKTQRLAQERAQWETQRTEHTRGIEAEKARLQSLAAQLLQRQNGGQQDPYASLAQRQWIDGQTMANVLKSIEENGFGGIQKAISERDTVIQALYTQLQQVQKQVQAFSGYRTNQNFEGRISNTLKELGLDDSMKDFAKETYLAYEGDDLDEQFPAILKQRYEQLQNHFRSNIAAKKEAAKRMPFTLAGKGGLGAAGAPKGLKGTESAKDTADYLWEQLQAQGE